MHAKVQAASAAFASTSVSCTLNAAVKAASAVFEYTATPASGAGSACPYSWSVVPSRCTRILYSTSLKTPICRIRNLLPYLSTPLDLTKKSPDMLRDPVIRVAALIHES
jgi:invasion protein IalB